MESRIEIRQLPGMHLAGIRVQGVESLPSAFEKIIAWAGPRGLMGPGTKMATMYHDSFRDTAPDQVRISAAIVLENAVDTGNLLEQINIPAGKFITALHRLQDHEFGSTWKSLFQWMNDQGYQKKEGQPFEIFHNNPHEDPEQKATVEFYIPIY
jgi:AraC family transcriptional regulator